MHICNNVSVIVSLSSHANLATNNQSLLLIFPFQEYPTLTTFFAGEIISRKRPFLTRKWDADEDVDRKHWVWTPVLRLESILDQCICRSPILTVFIVVSFCYQGKFQSFYKYAKCFNFDDFDYEALSNSDYVFMRWKVG